ncbi:hypothetical protein QBC34DRAFT_83873 [Podospora aff. communis PSN243]|uniref:Uncharacterized protein n=1 Tax=Podospora aff. communis PSN243 TaxID=3040156 RepID=A0AAV9GQT2_9PEZI|nr:hypothetical protein QBC34DRAFT_83873 [Podospora aff. communis PSN243]
MKSSIIFPTLAALTTAFPSSPYQVNPSSEITANTPLGTMKWTGPLSPTSNATTTLYGTAKSIYEQILTLNPSYSPWAFADFRADMEAKGITPEMIAAANAQVVRTPQSPNPAAAVMQRAPEWFDCGAGPDYVLWERCNEGRNYMRQLGGGRAQCGVEAGKCTRFSCAWGCGVFLCSRGSNYVLVDCASIANDMERIDGACRLDAWGNWWVKGRLVFDDHYTEVSLQSC